MPVSEEKDEDIISKYLLEAEQKEDVGESKDLVKDAVGKVSEYRERYKKGQLTVDDVKARPRTIKDDGFKRRENSFFSEFDKDLVLGDGTVDDFILN